MESETFELVKEQILKLPIVLYQGEITQKVKLRLLKEIEQSVEKQAYPLVIKKRLFIISEELLVNMQKSGLTDKVKPPYFCLSEDENLFYILSNNTIFNDERSIKEIRNRIENLNNNNAQTLKNIYITGIKIGYNLMDIFPNSQHKIGFAIVARKSNMKFLYNIEVVDEEVAYFSLIVRLRKS